jgi:hypothetical protein
MRRDYPRLQRSKPCHSSAAASDTPTKRKWKWIAEHSDLCTHPVHKRKRTIPLQPKWPILLGSDEQSLASLITLQRQACLNGIQPRGADFASLSH